MPISITLPPTTATTSLRLKRKFSSQMNSRHLAMRRFARYIKILTTNDEGYSVGVSLKLVSVF